MSSTKVKPEPIDKTRKDKAFLVVLLAVFIDVLGFGIIIPILPFLNINYGGDAFTGVGLISAYSLAAFLSGPLLGRLSDKVGRRPALLLTFIGATLSYVFLAFADSLFMLYVARILSGVMAGNLGIIMATAADMATPADRGKKLGYISAAYSMGFAIGPGLGGLFGGTVDNPQILVPGLMAAFTSFAAFILAWLYMDETSTTHKHEVSVKSPPLKEVIWPLARALLLLQFIISTFGQSAIFSIVPFWAEAVLQYDQLQVGVIMMGMGFIIALLQTFAVGPLFNRFGESNSLIIAMALQLFGTVPFLLGPDGVWKVIVCFPLMMGGLTLCFPALNSLLSRGTDKAHQGYALGVSSSLSALGRIVGPLSSGKLFMIFGPTAPFVPVAGAGVIIMLWAIWNVDEHHQEKRRNMKVNIPPPPDGI